MAEKKEINPVIRNILKEQAPRKGRRILSWLLFLGLLASCLLIPLAASMSPQQIDAMRTQHPTIAKASDALIHKLIQYHIVPPQPVPVADSEINKKLIPVTADTQNFRHSRSDQPAFLSLDKVWTPGHELDSAHKPWANDCKACHSMPFVQVQDKDCLACHKNVGDHVDRKLVTMSPQANHAIGDQKCASCHRDHNGEDSLKRQNKNFMAENCASCHGDIKKSFAKTKTANVSDFDTKHPEFRYQLALSNKPDDLARTRLVKGEMLKENTALKFPHDVHLKADGVKSPKGKVKVDCASCHTLNSDGLGFAKVTMKDHCQSCHDLKFEPSVSNREVPHGSVELVLSTLREFYSYVQVNTVPVDNKPLTAPINLVRPGHDEPVVASFVRSNGSSRSRAADAAVSLFEKTSCKVCHEISRISEPGRQGTSGRDLPQWKVAPVTPSHPWLTQSQFSHAKHRLAECTDCHSAKTSKKASDVLMPDIKVCRDCHTGSTPVSNKLVSDCGLCHGFHMPGHTPATASPQQTTLVSIIKSSWEEAGVTKSLVSKPGAARPGTSQEDAGKMNQGVLH